MKLYELIDEELNRSLGMLLYFEKEKTFLIELKDNLDEWTAPLLFTSFVKRGIYTIPRDACLLWVRERIIPRDRQNIQAILKNHRLKEYDEMALLALSKGRCAQDSICIEKRETLPNYIERRMQKNLTGMFPSGDRTTLCFFADDTTRRVDLRKLISIDGVDKILNNELLFQSGKIGAAGYYATFNDSIDIPASVLYANGKKLPVTKNDFISFVKNNVLDTKETGVLLGCSRQNISYMIRQNQLSPVKNDVMGNLYLKEDVLKNTW